MAELGFSKGRFHKFLRSPYLYHGTDRGEGGFGRKARVQIAVKAVTLMNIVYTYLCSPWYIEGGSELSVQIG